MFQSNKQIAHSAATRMKQALQRLEMKQDPLNDKLTTVQGSKNIHCLVKQEIQGVTRFYQAMEVDIANIRKVASEFEAIDLGLGKTYNKMN
ncbi:TIGR04197 family type VII secretion effector [Listeria grayi]|uniref:TIGR04197 family type VII secretion effector n=1 Tax=Listeria grayi TaxID=1641 RepID=UPI0016285065|nr:TIGR04197 family type VII secretion effector [Listeria grayi]MBC1922902.1 TIGR04197 family type VII secretion effector [Listeria grayi]